MLCTTCQIDVYPIQELDDTTFQLVSRCPRSECRAALALPPATTVVGDSVVELALVAPTPVAPRLAAPRPPFQASAAPAVDPETQMRARLAELEAQLPALQKELAKLRRIVAAFDAADEPS